jgi:uncharacterized protein (TIGR02145 family)
LNYNAEGSVCYENKPENCEKYGRLYDWNTAMKACPEGWHLPSHNEWWKLIETVGGENTAGKHLKAKSGWNDNEGKSGNGLDKYGFSALPGSHYNGEFDGAGYYGGWWNSTVSEDNESVAHYWNMSHNSDRAGWYYDAKSTAFSVRCIKYTEFLITPPDKWTAIEHPGGRTFISPNKADSSAMMNFAIYTDTTSNFQPSEHFEFVFNNISGFNPNLTIIRREDFKTAKGLEGKKMVAIIEQGGVKVRLSLYLFSKEKELNLILPNNNKYMIATCTALASIGEKFDKIFDKSMKTFEWVK